jgi:spore coat protein U-like protein
MNRRILSVLACTAALAALFVAIAPAKAATTTSNINVSANVGATCTMTDAAVNFGSYDSAAAAPLDVASNLVVTCTKGTVGTVTLAGTATRQMTSPAGDKLSYQLFVDSTRSTAWAGTVAAPLTGTGAAQNVAVYGRIATNQNVPAGTYTDVVVATLFF